MSTPDDGVTVDNRDPKTIRNEIDEATANLTETLGALQDKLQPDALVAEAKEKAMGGVVTLGNRLSRGARRHPIAAALVGIGALWLIGRSFIADKEKIGGGLFSFTLGAMAGIGAYRAVIAEQHWDDEDLDMTAEVEHDVNVPPTHPSHAALE